LKLSEVSSRLNRTPLMIKGNIESLICAKSEVEIISGGEFIKKLDSSRSLIEKVPTIIHPSNSKLESRFKKISIKEPFYSLSPNEYLFDRFDIAKKVFIKQSEIRNRIINKSGSVDLIIFIIVDGLSFTDVVSWGNVKPCLVDTLTTTHCGFKNIIGPKNPIIYGLYKEGFRHFYGFSYWDIDNTNELNSFIFRKINKFKKVQSFGEILSLFPQNLIPGSYIQLVLQGLDGIAHKNRDEPLIEPIVAKLWENVQKIAEKVKKLKMKARIFLTSDHGILWKHKSALEKIPSHTYLNHHHMRHYDSAVPLSHCMTFSCGGKVFSALNYPYVLRKLRTNEWGVHGGVSAEESITPLLTLDIN